MCGGDDFLKLINEYIVPDKNLLEPNRAYYLFLLDETLRQPRCDASSSLDLIYFEGFVDVRSMHSATSQPMEIPDTLEPPPSNPIRSALYRGTSPTKNALPSWTPLRP